MNSPGQWIFHVGQVETVEEPDLNNSSEYYTRTSNIVSPYLSFTSLSCTSFTFKPKRFDKPCPYINNLSVYNHTYYKSI